MTVIEEDDCHLSVMMLAFTVNRFGGVVVDSGSLGDSAESLLASSKSLFVIPVPSWQVREVI